MRENFSEWECMPGSAPGLIESMDAAGFAAMSAQWEDGKAATGELGAVALATPAPEDHDAAPCLDLRHLPAPEPLQRAMAAADALAPGVKLKVLMPTLSIPLLQLLDARGFAVRTELLKDGTAYLFVERGNN